MLEAPGKAGRGAGADDLAHALLVGPAILLVHGVLSAEKSRHEAGGASARQMSGLPIVCAGVRQHASIVDVAAFVSSSEPHLL